tara:strand:+ start:45 stop:317 length:273 start_codon:yes stop_codon:yes gene_type:complete
VASYSFKKEDLDKPKDDTGIKFPKGIRHDKKMIEVQRKNNKLYGLSDKEISRRANGEVGQANNKNVFYGERGGRYRIRHNKNGEPYRDYF